MAAVSKRSMYRLPLPLRRNNGKEIRAICWPARSVSRLLALALAAAMALAATACDPKEPDTSAPGESTVSTSAAEESQMTDPTQGASETKRTGTSAGTRPNGTTKPNTPASGTKAPATTKATTKPSSTPSESQEVKTVLSGGERYVVDYVVTAATGADPTGKKDSSDAINRALILVGYSGGGTVYLPAGTYLLEDSLTIPTFTNSARRLEGPRQGRNGRHDPVRLGEARGQPVPPDQPEQLGGCCWSDRSLPRAEDRQRKSLCRDI